MLSNRVVDRERQDTENESNCGNDRQELSFFALTRCGIDLSFADSLERCLVEVATLVGVRIEEETLGATFHFSQALRIRIS